VATQLGSTGTRTTSNSAWSRSEAKSDEACGYAATRQLIEPYKMEMFGL
jgi:hypothetical protein